jgi:hypothetical protein
VGVVLFCTLYAVAGARWMPQSAFLVGLVFVFALVTALWMAVEQRQGRGRGALARLGRVAFGLVVVAVAAPILVLIPLFWLESQLPPDAGLNAVLGPVMTIVLISLALVALVNAVGGVLALVRTALGNRRRGARI